MFRIKFGWIFMRYTPSMWWWELMLLLKKLSLATFLRFGTNHPGVTPRPKRTPTPPMSYGSRPR